MEKALPLLDGPTPLTHVLLSERNSLRKNTQAEQRLITLICELPEENDHHTERYSFQLGMGLAHYEQLTVQGTLARERAVYEPEIARHAFNVFWATLPRNQFDNKEEVYECVEHQLAGAAVYPLPPHVNHYTVTSAIAFIAGYEVTKRLLS